MIGDSRSMRVTALEERPGFAGARRTLGSVRGHLGAPHINGRAMSGPPTFSGPMIGDWRSRSVTAFEERPGFAGARRTLGSVRGHLGAPHVNGRAMSGPPTYS